ncbi:TPA: hypothetical protein ACLBJU_001980, partial [Neisseria meningitidis]
MPTGLDSRFCGNDGGGVSVFADRFLWFFGCWIPAFAGMTAVGFLFFPINSCCVAFLDSRFCGNDGRWGFCFFRWIPVALRFWIPAFAGMTVGGVSVFSDKVLPRCV